VDVVLPAGGRIHGNFAAAAGTEVKALIRLGSSTVLRRTIDCVRSTGRAGRIVVIGPEEALEEGRSAGADLTATEGDTGPANILRGLDALATETEAPRTLVLTTDLPFLTADAITAFMDACPAAADLAVAVVRREDYEGRFPGSANTYVRLRNGEFTLGCAFLLNGAVLRANRTRIEQVFQARKSQFGMARLLGLPMVIRFLTRRLTLPHVIDRCGELLHCSGAAVLDAAPEIAFDIDREEDFHYAAQHV